MGVFPSIGSVFPARAARSLPLARRRELLTRRLCQPLRVAIGKGLLGISSSSLGGPQWGIPHWGIPQLGNSQLIKVVVVLLY